jgi:hypothetical protein
MSRIHRTIVSHTCQLAALKGYSRSPGTLILPLCKRGADSHHELAGPPAGVPGNREPAHCGGCVIARGGIGGRALTGACCSDCAVDLAPYCAEPAASRSEAPHAYPRLMSGFSSLSARESVERSSCIACEPSVATRCNKRKSVNVNRQSPDSESPVPTASTSLAPLVSSE